MTEEKRNRIMAALTVNAILLLAVLIAVVVYQLAVIVKLNKAKRDITTQITQYEQEIETETNKLDRYKTEEWLKNKAYEYGFIFPGDR